MYVRVQYNIGNMEPINVHEGKLWIENHIEII
jgi:hypothetical protein